MKSFIAAAVYCFAISLNIFAQNNVLRELLDLPAPAAVTRPESKSEASNRPKEFYSKNQTPSDDAPIEELLDYWMAQNYGYRELGYNLKPSQKTVERILEVCEQEPEKLTNYLKILPSNPATADIIKNLYDARQNSETQIQGWDYQVKNWLKYKSRYFTDELLKEARQVQDEKEYIVNEKELLALARIDWDLTLPIIQRLENDKSQPVSSALAKWAFYVHAMDNDDDIEAQKYRDQLKAIVADRSASDGTRDLALDALVKEKDWDGRDDWYISLLGDETLFDLRVNGASYTGLTTFMTYSPPEKWAERMINLVGNKNAAVHNAAVRNLYSLLNEMRPDVVVALLPWISNPEWAKETTGYERKNLIEMADKIDVPEAVPHLIWVVANDEDNLLAAAQSLIRYKSAQAVPALRLALQKETDEQSRSVLIEAVIASGGLMIVEQMTALETYANMISTPEGKKLIERSEPNYARDGDEEEPQSKEEVEPLPLTLSIGKFIAEMNEPDDALIWQVIERRRILLKTKPAIARFFTEVLNKWKGRAADLFRFDQIKNNSADVETIIKLLTARKKLRETLAAEIAQMYGATGGASGLAACLTENESDLIGVFHRNDADARVAVLACARLLRAPLPIAEVGTLLKNPNKLLALAAERYLETTDSPEARTLIWNAHPNEAVILGARDVFNPSKKPINNYLLVKLFKSVNGFSGELQWYAGFDKDEEAVQKEVLENADLRMVYAYNGNYIRVYQDRAVFSYYEDAARYHERNLTKEEYEAFQRLIQEKNLGSVSPIYECGSLISFPCFPSQFLIINRNGGRRVFGYADYTKGIGELGIMFSKFQRTAGNLRYELEKHVAGLEVIVADNRFSVKSVWKHAEDLRVLVVDKIKETERETELEQLNKADNANPNLKYDDRMTLIKKREREREFENYSWRTIGKERSIGEAIAEPTAIPFLKNRLETLAEFVFDADEFGWKVQTGNFQIRTGSGEIAGLYRTNHISTTRIFEGGYDSPLVSPDGKWAIVVKSDPDLERAAEWLMRVDLTTKREYPIKLPPVNTTKNVAFVPAHNKFLVFRAQTIWDGNKDERVTKQSEYYLIDAATGAAQPVKGEFRPLEQQTYRPLQPTGKPDEFWAAISEKTYTNFGVYNAKTFTFRPLLKIPEISLTSMDIWVDEPAGKIFFVYEGSRKDDGHLLSLPLPK